MHLQKHIPFCDKQITSHGESKTSSFEKETCFYQKCCHLGGKRSYKLLILFLLDLHFRFSSSAAYYLAQPLHLQVLMVPWVVQTATFCKNAKHCSQVGVVASLDLAVASLHTFWLHYHRIHLTPKNLEEADAIALVSAFFCRTAFPTTFNKYANRLRLTVSETRLRTVDVSIKGQNKSTLVGCRR